MKTDAHSSSPFSKGAFSAFSPLKRGASSSSSPLRQGGARGGYSDSVIASPSLGRGEAISPSFLSPKGRGFQVRGILLFMAFLFTFPAFAARLSYQGVLESHNGPVTTPVGMFLGYASMRVVGRGAWYGRRNGPRL
ncbi:MAG: hypothetical protein HY538_09285 [Deltaproteobacteria bacterium]|nr:hypothetical protein [Deltaproteobacteria bacterium]